MNKHISNTAHNKTSVNLSVYLCPVDCAHCRANSNGTCQAVSVPQSFTTISELAICPLLPREILCFLLLSLSLGDSVQKLSRRQGKASVQLRETTPKRSLVKVTRQALVSLNQVDLFNTMVNGIKIIWFSCWRSRNACLCKADPQRSKGKQHSYCQGMPSPSLPPPPPCTYCVLSQ